MGARDEGFVGRWAVAAVALLVVMTLAVLAGLRMAGNRKDCTLIGSSPSHVSARVERPGWTVEELCVDDGCEKADHVGVSADAGVHSYRATLVAADGTTTEHSGEVTTFEVWPNGEGCGSRRAYGQVVISADGTVTTQDPWAAASGG